MHEVARAREIYRSASSLARDKGGLPPKVVRVRIGAWTGIDADHLKHDFEREFPGTELEVEVVNPQGVCTACGVEFDPDKFTTRCPSCGSIKVVLRQSAEYEVVNVEV